MYVFLDHSTSMTRLRFRQSGTLAGMALKGHCQPASCQNTGPSDLSEMPRRVGGGRPHEPSTGYVDAMSLAEAPAGRVLTAKDDRRRVRYGSKVPSRVLKCSNTATFGFRNEGCTIVAAGRVAAGQMGGSTVADERLSCTVVDNWMVELGTRVSRMPSSKMVGTSMMRGMGHDAAPGRPAEAPQPTLLPVTARRPPIGPVMWYNRRRLERGLFKCP